MSIFTPERNGSDTGYFDFDGRDWNYGDRFEQEPFPTDHLVGRVGLAGALAFAEERLEKSESLSQEDQRILASIEADLRPDEHDY